jgi:hypothetical protein
MQNGAKDCDKSGDGSDFDTLWRFGVTALAFTLAALSIWAGQP